jgi:hypothetical protein
MIKQIFNKQPDMTKSSFEFKLRYTFDKRKDESTELISKFPNNKPVIIEKLDLTPIKDIIDHKYLLNKNITIAQLLVIIRQKLNAKPDKKVYLYLANEMAPATKDTIEALYEKYSDKDGFLYLTYYL